MQELHTALEQQRTARGTQAQATGHVARERILADDNVDKPPELKTASEKLVAAAYLLQAMPKPSTTSGRNLRYRGESPEPPGTRVLLCCLLHQYLGRGNTQHLLVGIQTPGSGHRQLARQEGEAAYRTRAAAHRAWRACPGVGTRCPGMDPSRRQCRQTSETKNGRRKTRRCGLPTPSNARAIDFGSQPAP